MFMIKSEPSQVEVQFACTLMGTVPNHISTNASNSLSLPEGGSQWCVGKCFNNWLFGGGGVAWGGGVGKINKNKNKPKIPDL